MTVGIKIAGFAAASVILAILAAPVLAAPLSDHPDAWIDDDLYQWHGATAYDNGVGFSGTVEWAVFGPGDLPLPSEFSGLSGWTYDPADFTYAYQVSNDGLLSLSRFAVDLFNPGDNDGAVDLGDVGSGLDIEPSSTSLWVHPLFGFVQYNFAGAGVLQGEDTTGLVFQSPNIPMLAEGLVVDGGDVQDFRIPSASAVPIPEPSTLLMLACGLGMVFLAELSSREIAK